MEYNFVRTYVCTISAAAKVTVALKFRTAYNE